MQPATVNDNIVVKKSISDSRFVIGAIRFVMIKGCN